MEQLVLRVRRNLAPHLRSVIGSWLCCQFDTYAPVASAAQRAFSAAFSEEKQIEAIMFCKKDLVEVGSFLQLIIVVVVVVVAYCRGLSSYLIHLQIPSNDVYFVL